MYFYKETFFLKRISMIDSFLEFFCILSAVPNGGDIDDIIFNIIDNLIFVDNKSAVYFITIFQQ